MIDDNPVIGFIIGFFGTILLVIAIFKAIFALIAANFVWIALVVVGYYLIKYTFRKLLV